MSLDDYFLGDAWRREEIPRSKPYEPPTSPIDDFSTDCVCVKINRAWVPFLTGVLDLLVNRSLWVHEDPDYAPQEIVKLIETLSGEVTTMTCDPNPIEDIIFEDGVLKICRNGVCVAIDGTEEIVTGVGAIGTGWEVEQGGAFTEVPNPAGCGDCDQYPDKPAYDKSGNLRSCAIATNLTEWIMEKYQDCLDAAEAVAATINAADAILLLFPPAYIFWDAANDAVNEWFEMGIAVSRALDTVGLREDMKEWLYCELVNNNHTMTEAIWNGFKDEFIIIGDSIYLYLGQFKYGAIENEAHKASYGEETGCETFDCGICINTPLDFSINDFCSFPRVGQEGTTYPDAPYATYEAGVGWESVCLEKTGINGRQRLQVFVDLGAVVDITAIRYVWESVGGSPTQETVATVSGSDPQNGTFNTIYTGNNAAGEKSFTGTWSTRYLNFTLERQNTSAPCPAHTYRLLEVEITTA